MPTSSLFDPYLSLAAEVVDDLERIRVANANRLQIMTRDEVDSDGDDRGFKMTLGHPDVARLAGIVDAVTICEHQAVLNLQRLMRKHPLGPWMGAQVGIGEKQGARLLAAVGDPYVNAAKGEPRTVSQLWAYCGLHVLPAGHTVTEAQTRGAGGVQDGDPGHAVADTQGHLAGVAARRQRGVRVNWSPTAKMRAYLVATSCMKQTESPYRDVYLTRREHTATTHPDWTLGHSHNDALRITAKRILRELWRESRRLHEEDTP